MNQSICSGEVGRERKCFHTVTHAGCCKRTAGYGDGFSAQGRKLLSLAFGLYFDGVDERIILDRRKIQLQHSMGRGLYVIKGNHRDTVLLAL
jgi:hypothetical protein